MHGYSAALMPLIRRLSSVDENHPALCNCTGPLGRRSNHAVTLEGERRVGWGGGGEEGGSWGGGAGRGGG